MKILTNLAVAALAICSAFLVAFAMDAAEFDWSSFGTPIVSILGLEMYDDRVYLSFIFTFIGLLSLVFYGLFKSARSIVHSEEPLKALFASISISAFAFILMAWFRTEDINPSLIYVASLIVFLAFLFLFQFRGQDGFFGRLCAVIEIPVVFLTVLYVVLAAAVWLIGSVVMTGFLFDGSNWIGETARPIYWATNAVAFAIGLFAILGLLYVFGAKRLVTSLLDVTEAESLYEVVALPLVSLSIVAMTTHALLSSVFDERLSGFF